MKCDGHTHLVRALQGGLACSGPALEHSSRASPLRLELFSELFGDEMEPQILAKSGGFE